MYRQEMIEPHLAIITFAELEPFIRKIEIFKHLPSAVLSGVVQRIKRTKYKKGQRIIEEETEAEGVFFVFSGSVKLTKQDEQGNEMIVCIKKKGEIFAEACLFNQSSTCYPATAAMLEDGDIAFLNKKDLELELLNQPELAIQMIRYMSEQLQEFTATLRDIALLDVYTKTIKTLERLAQKFRGDLFSRDPIEIPLNVQEFATVVGVSRESISRVFSKLKKDGFIDLRERKIIITDWCLFCSLIKPGY
ncbi:Crp/Fnr family transcriptional regulator [Bacillus sp. CGMCC 1.16607]|uniref:Crp/Fnr family transcriptional regulator n=1 Tax=Bacillus sp. CGMCC 1.16607 TaxID=3351842 RepID=UPI00362CBC95